MMIRALLLATILFATPATAKDRIREHLVDLLDVYGLLFSYELDVPAALIVATTNGRTEMRFFGVDANGVPPNARSLFRIGSISKVIAGQVLATLVDQGIVRFDERVSDLVPDFATGAMRLIDPVTQSSGLPRELDVAPGADGSPDTGQTQASIAAFLDNDPFLFEPGSSVHYSNIGFQILGASLGAAAEAPYPEVLDRTVLAPLGMVDTGPSVSEADRDRLLLGHFFDGTPMDYYPSGPLVSASGGLFTTAADIARWMEWNLSGDPDPIREAYQTVYRPRESFAQVSTIDESGLMDGMGLGWVWMKPTPYRPEILQKSGAHGGYMAYVALAPTRRAGVFVMITQFDFAAAEQMTDLANSILAEMPFGTE